MTEATNTRQTIRTEWATRNRQAAAETVEQLVDTLAAVEHELLVSVGLLRQAGWSWANIADAVSLTRQGAQQRFGKRAPVALVHLEADARQYPEAAAELARLQRRLSVSQVRERWDVYNAAGELVSRHYVADRAEDAKRRAGEGARIEHVTKRDKVRVGTVRCRTCGELSCRCDDGRAHGAADEAGAVDAWHPVDVSDEPSF